MAVHTLMLACVLRCYLKVLTLLLLFSDVVFIHALDDVLVVHVDKE